MLRKVIIVCGCGCIFACASQNVVRPLTTDLRLELKLLKRFPGPGIARVRFFGRTRWLQASQPLVLEARRGYAFFREAKRQSFNDRVDVHLELHSGGRVKVTLPAFAMDGKYYPFRITSCRMRQDVARKLMRFEMEGRALGKGRSRWLGATLYVVVRYMKR